MVAKRPRLGAGRGGLAETDAKERKKWVERLLVILRHLVGPSWKRTRDLEGPTRGEDGLAGAARPGTIKVRVRAWEAMARWLLARRGRAWPGDEVDVIDYLWACMGERPSVSFPRSLGSAVLWIEVRAGVPAATRISTSELLKKNIETAQKEAEEEGRRRRKAPRFPVVVLIALEEYVVGNGPEVMRVVAWTRLMKVQRGAASGRYAASSP